MKCKFSEDLGLEKEAIDKIMAENGNDVNAAKGGLEALKQQLRGGKPVEGKGTPLADIQFPDRYILCDFAG